MGVLQPQPSLVAANDGKQLWARATQLGWAELEQPHGPCPRMERAWSLARARRYVTTVGVEEGQRLHWGEDSAGAGRGAEAVGGSRQLALTPTPSLDQI